MKEHILYVDDEVRVLHGLKRSLRKMHKKWDMCFVTSGKEALSHLEENPCEVVVTDMRMPGMSGAQLLENIREVYPDIARIVLSGHCSQEMVLRTLGPAHRYLAKPCPGDVLIEAIEKTLTLRRLLGTEALRSLISGIGSLSAMPRAYHELVDELANKDASAESLARIISKDLAMMADTLKLTNSAYFGLPSAITDIKRAVAFLGFETVKSITLIACLYGRHKDNKQVSPVIDKLCQESIGIGQIAKMIAFSENEDSLLCDQACCAATLCHIGTLILVSTWPDKFSETIELVEEENLSIDIAEQKVFSGTHAELGAYLLGLWGFPDLLTEAVAFHHNPVKSGHKEINLFSYVYVAQVLGSTNISKDSNPEGLASLFDMEYINQIGAEDRLEKWCKIVQNVQNETAIV